jgi:hypothetical protein
LGESQAGVPAAEARRGGEESQPRGWRDRLLASPRRAKRMGETRRRQQRAKGRGGQWWPEKGVFLNIPALRQVLWLGALNKRQDFR